MTDEDIQQLMQLLFNHPDINGPTYSDTPGMGNAIPYWMNGLSGRESYNGFGLGQEIKPGMPKQVPMNQRMDLEMLLMDKSLNDALQGAQTRQDLLRLREQDRFKPEGQWDYLPGTGMGRYM